MKPLVSVVLPVRNEQQYIASCLQSILSQDYPNNRLEIIVVDGLSDDNTVEIIRKFQKTHNNIHLYTNAHKTVSPALNIGIRHAVGEYVVRMDSHATYEPDYISQCIRHLSSTHAYNVGGVLFTQPGSHTAIARAIALALTSRFGVGCGNTFRTSHEQGYVDTVPFGAFKKEIFDKIGLFNECLFRTEDIEFNARIKRAGGRIFITPLIKSYYHARSNLFSLWKQHWQNGYEIIMMSKTMFYAASLRHFIPFLFVVSLIIGLLFFSFPFFRVSFFFIACVYLIINLFFSFTISLQSKIKYFPLLIVTFLTLHFSYGLGSLWALISMPFIKRL